MSPAGPARRSGVTDFGVAAENALVPGTASGFAVINDAERLLHEGLLAADGDGYKGWRAEPKNMQ